MSEDRLHSRIRLLMAVILLLLAYLLPGICIRKTEEGQRQEEEHTKEKGTGVQEEKGVKEKGESGQGGKGVKEKSAGVQEKIMEEGEEGEKNSAGRGIRIVLDPGHGGEDPGMVGIDGVKEKDINLQIAGILGQLLEESGCSVFYTRNSDQGLHDRDASHKKAQDMQRRCALIEEKQPTLTVSIHQNSYSDPSVRGPQVFYYEHSVQGKELAACVQEELNRQLEIARPREIKGNTNYYILKRSPGVTILVECSFLSNPEEGKKIQTASYQQAAARAICDGIFAYLEKEG